MNTAMESLRSRMRQVLDSVGQEAHLEEGGLEIPNTHISSCRAARTTALVPWMLSEWRKISIPEWRDILTESLRAGDSKREEYARWMLKEILLDAEYDEPIS